MKRIVYIAIAVFCLACAPQKQLAKLLQHHPELIRDSIVVLSDTVYRERMVIEKPFVMNDIKDTVTVTAGKAKASVVPTDTGYKLIVEQLPDTSVLTKRVKVPVLTTETKVIHKELTWWQRFRIDAGGIAIIILCIWVLLVLAWRFLKR